MRRLAAECDVLLQNFRPGVMDGLGLGYEDVKADNPTSSTPRSRASAARARTATAAPTTPSSRPTPGWPMNQADPYDGVPVFLRQTAADKITALYACQAITAALFAGRESGHGGQHVELSMTDAVVSFLWADSAANEVLLDSDHSHEFQLRRRLSPDAFHRRLGHRHADLRPRLRRHVQGARRRGLRRPAGRHHR